MPIIIKRRKYQVFDKDGLPSVYTSHIYANNKKEAFNKAREVYGNEVGSVEYCGWAEIFVNEN